MNEKQWEELSMRLTEDILARYNNPEYFDYDIVEQYAQDHQLKKQ